MQTMVMLAVLVHGAHMVGYPILDNISDSCQMPTISSAPIRFVPTLLELADGSFYSNFECNNTRHLKHIKLLNFVVTRTDKCLGSPHMANIQMSKKIFSFLTIGLDVVDKFMGSIHNTNPLLI